MSEPRAPYRAAARRRRPAPELESEPAARALAAIYGQVTEDEVLRWVVDLARTYGLLCYHTHWSLRSQAGFPDVVLVPDPARWPELTLARMEVPLIRLWEIKTQRNKLDPPQLVWQAALQAVQALAPDVVEYRVVRPSDKADVEASLARMVETETREDEEQC